MIILRSYPFLIGADKLEDIMITESGGIEENKPPELKSLNSFAKLLDGAVPLEGTPFSGMGKRKYIQIKLKKHNIAFELFAESIISPAPADVGVGYEETDVIQNHGVIRYNITNDTDTIEDRRFEGDYIPFTDFLEQYISGDNARNSIELYMDQLIEKSKLTETFFTNMNKLWNDREINTPRIYEIPIC